MYTNPNTSTISSFSYFNFPDEKRKSVINKMHKKIITKRKLVLVEPSEKNYTMEQNNYGTANRLLRIKSEAINNT